MKDVLYRFVASVKIGADQAGVPKTTVDNTTIANVLNTTFIVLGSLCVLFIIIGGIRYIISGGDPSGISRAKDTILYAIVGLVITVAAFTIESVVLGIFH